MKPNSHKNQKATQIYLPFLVICLVTVILIVLLLRRFGTGSTEFIVMANISAIFVIITFVFILSVAFIFIVVVNIVIYRSSKGIENAFPRINEIMSHINQYLTKTAHAGLKPFWYVEIASAIFNFGTKRKE